MKPWQWAASVAFALVASAGGGGCGACGTPEAVVVEGTPDDEVKIDWDEANAMGLYVVAPDAVIPGGPDDHVQGTVYWVIEATDFPDGFAGPVTYGQLPGGTKDATEEHGGTRGGAPLYCDTPYKIAIVALGGSAETMVEWACPPER